MLNSDESRRYGYVEEKEDEDANGGVLVKRFSTTFRMKVLPMKRARETRIVTQKSARGDLSPRGFCRFGFTLNSSISHRIHA